MEKLNVTEQIDILGGKGENILNAKERMLQLFEDSVKRYVKNKHYNYLDDLDFYIIFNGLSTRDEETKIHTGELRCYLEEYIENEIEYYCSATENIRKIVNNVYKARRRDIINIKLEKYVSYICSKAEEYSAELGIKKILLENKDEILEDCKGLYTEKYFAENFEDIAEILSKYIIASPVQISRIQYNVIISGENCFDSRVEILIEQILPHYLILENLEIPIDVEYVESMEDIVEQLEKIAEDINNGKIKDIETFDLDMYM